MTPALRPLGFGEILDGAFTLYRRSFSVFFGISLLPQIPLVLFWLIAPALIAPGAGSAAFIEAVPVLLLPYSVVVAFWTMGALTHAAGTAVEGERPRIGSSLARGARRFLSVAIASVIATALIFFGLILLIVPGLVLLAVFFAVHPAAVIEERGPFSALGRSRQLSRGARGRILALLIVAWFITLLPAMGMWMFAGVAGGVSAFSAAALDPDSNVWLAALMQAASILLSALTWPFLLIVTTLLYYDRRARTEAPDLESAAAALHAERS